MATDAHVQAAESGRPCGDRPCGDRPWVFLAVALSFIILSGDFIRTVAGTLLGLLLIFLAALTLLLAPLLLFIWAICASRRSYRTPLGRGFRTLMEWTWKTYLAWAIFSLYNFDLLWVLALPTWLPVMFYYYGPFIPFMAPPFACALCITLLCYGRLRHPLAAWGLRVVLPFLFNTLLIIAFLGCAEGYRAALMARDLAAYHPSSVRTCTFLQSLLNSGKAFHFSPHGVMIEDGITYYWDYRTRKFEARP